MTKFISKYKWKIGFWLILMIIIWFWQPTQKNYYLDNNITTFKSNYLNPILIGTWIIACFFIFGISFKKTKTIKLWISGSSYFALSFAVFLFFSQDLFLATALFVNRQVKQDSFQKAYVVNYLAGTDKTKDNFILYDISLKRISTDRKLTERLYRPSLNQNDTITLKFDKGLFGIEFQNKAIANK